jgi:long-subunit fatty acid transport protein
MESGYPDPLRPPGNSDTSSSGSYCFIATAYTAVEPARLINSIVDANKILYCLCILISALFIAWKHGTGKRIVKGTTLEHAVYILRVLVFAFLVLAPVGLQAATLFQSVGVASSPNPVGSGARAMGMGGAFIGVADDATAASWNTAGLIQLEKPELSIVVDDTERKETFFSSIHSEIDNTGEVDYLELNYFSAAYPFHFYRNMVVSVNFQRLYDFKRNFSHRYDYSAVGVDLEQYKDFKQDGSIGALGLAGAVQITPVLSLGATLNIWTDELLWENGWDETFTEHSVGTQGGAPVTMDTRIEDNYSNFRGINVNVGLLWDMNRYLTIGAVVKTPFTANIHHEFRYRQTQTYAAPVDSTSAIRQGITEDVKLDMPLSYGLGFAWRFSDAFSVDLDVYRTNWSKYILTDDQGNEFSPIDGRPKSESNVEDTTQVRIGAEYIFIMQDKHMAIPIRGGLFYDPEPTEDSPNDFYGVSVGSGIAYKRFVFDIAYQLRWGNSVDTGNLIATSKADIIQHSLLSSLIVHF